MKKLRIRIIALLLVMALAGGITLFATAAPIDINVPTLPRSEYPDDPDADPKWTKPSLGHDALSFMGGYEYESAFDGWSVILLGAYSGDTDVGYCLTPGRPIRGTDLLDSIAMSTLASEYIAQNVTITDAATLEKLLGRVLHYGWDGVYRELPVVGYTDIKRDNFAYYYATQLVLWETIVGERDNEFNLIPDSAMQGKDRVFSHMRATHPVKSEIEEHYDAIVTSVQNHSKLPSFVSDVTTAPSHELVWNGTTSSLTLTDTNGVLADWSFSTTNTDLSLTKSGNTLTISSSTPISGTASIQATKQIASNSVNAYRNQTATHQDVAKVGGVISETFTGYLNVKGPTFNLALSKSSGIDTVTGAGAYSVGDTVTVNATVAADSIWTNWTSSNPTLLAGSTAQQFSFTMPAGNVTLTANAVAKNYTISANPTTLDFGEKSEGYWTIFGPLAKTVEITNSGNSTVTIPKPTALNYVINGTFPLSIAAGGNASFSVQPKTGLSAGTYHETITVNATEGSSTSFAVDFDVNGALSATINPASATIIGGNSQLLTANATGGTGSYTYEWSTGGTSFSTNQSVNVSPSVTTTYQVKVTDQGDSDNTATATITVIAPSYSISASPNAVTFDARTTGYSEAPAAQEIVITNSGNSPVTIANAPSASSFNISGTFPMTIAANGGTGSFTIQPKVGLSKATYAETVTFLTDQNTEDDISVSFTVNDSLAVSIQGDLAIMRGESTELTANVVGGTLPYSYRWNTTPAETSQKITVSPDVTTEYTVTVTDASPTAKSATATVTVILPTFSISANPTTLDFGEKSEGYWTIFGPLAKTVEITNSGNSTVTIPKPTALNYVINGTFPLSIAAGGNASFSVQPKTGLSAGTYHETITVNATEGSSTSFAVDFDVNGALSATINPASATIIGGNSQLLTANATGGTGSYTYEWSTGGTSFSTNQSVNVSPSVTTTYQVKVTDQGDSDNTATATITVIAQDDALKITQHPQNATVRVGRQASFSVGASGIAPITYQWQRSYDNGATWESVNSAATATFTTQPARYYIHRIQVRCAVSNSLNTVYSDSAILTVVLPIHFDPTDHFVQGDAIPMIAVVDEDPSIKIEDLSCMYVNNDALSNNSEYVGKSGSIIAAFDLAYLNSLPAGTYQVRIDLINGCYALGTFTVQEPGAPAIPKTGDETPFALLGGLLLIGCIGLSVSVAVRRKQRVESSVR